jgi:hypothetical protein
MPFRLEAIEAICRLTDEYRAKYPVTPEQRDEIHRSVNRIVAANQLLEGSGVERLADGTVAVLIVLLISG